MKAILAGSIILPAGSEEAQRLTKDLTFIVKDGIKGDYEVRAFRKNRSTISIPRSFGERYCKSNGVEIVSELSEGKPLGRLPAIKLLEYQKPFVDEWVNTAIDCNDFTVCAHTGSGKTIMSLEVIRRLGRTAIVIVDQEFLRDQWIDNAKKFLKLKDTDIGIVQGKKFQVEGRKLVLGMVQTLYNKTLPKEFYDNFGTVVFDESHTVGAEQFSAVLMQFSAKVRFGISATPDRKDALQRLLTYNLGDRRITLEKEHKESGVMYVKYNGVISWYSNISPKTGRYVTEISDDADRNHLIVQLVRRMYDRNRNLLVIGDRIEQLHHLMNCCIYSGIPEESMGVVSGFKVVYKYDRDIKPPRKPYGLEKGCEYTPVSYQAIRKRMPKKELDVLKNTKQIVFATYSMFSKGVDVPRLDAGIDCTPRASAVQVHGRILRSVPGKKEPLWITIYDYNSYKAGYQFAKRVQEYKASNVSIYEYDIDRGRRKVPDIDNLVYTIHGVVRLLKDRRIEVDIYGNNVLV